jgi:hypothetical protein
LDDPQHEERDDTQIVGTIAPAHEVEEVLLAFRKARRCSVPFASGRLFENECFHHFSGILEVPLRE